MSEINQQLNALSRQQPASGTQPPPLQAAVVKPVRERRIRRWGVVGLCLVAATGSAGWWLGAGKPAPAAPAAVAAPFVAEDAPAEEPRQTPEPVSEPIPEPAAQQSQAIAAAVPEEAGSASVQQSPVATAVSEQVSGSADAPSAAVPAKAVEGAVAARQHKRALAEGQPDSPAVKPASASSSAAQPPPVPAQKEDATGAMAMDADETLVIETVELDGEQLARVAYQRAEKALKTGDSRKAIRQLREAVRYQPSWILARQKLAALQYGRGETRQALATLQEGLVLDDRQPDLRLTLAKLLINESQPQAALNALEQLPIAGYEEYLAMRGALAQQLSQPELARSSYQQLVKEQPYDGRWWMGLGIALEQSQAPDRAREAYRQALRMGRISHQSQQFIQQRLALLEAQEG